MRSALLALALACAWPLAASAAPHASAKAVDCIWAAVPETLKAQIPASADMDAFDTLMKGWDPSDTEIGKLAHDCGVADTPNRAAGSTAGYAAAATAMQLWAKARLAADYQLHDADLARLWRALEHPDAVTLAQNFENRGDAPLEVGTANLKAAFDVISPLDDTEGRLLSAYLYASAQLDEIEAPG